MDNRDAHVYALTTEKGHICKMIDLEDDSVKFLCQSTLRIGAGQFAYIDDRSHGFHIKPLELYVTTNELIQDGDWFIQLNNINQPVDARQADASALLDYRKYPYDKFCKKIIATTDRSLKTKRFKKGSLRNLGYNLPNVRMEFVEFFCKQGGVYDVTVEYKDGKPTLRGRGGERTIAINTVQKTYTRSEVVTLIMDTALEFGIMHPPKDDGTISDQITKWTKKKL